MISYVLVFACMCALAASAPTAHIFLIIGQSNSVGYNTGGHTSEDVTFPNIIQTSCCVNGEINNNQCQLISGQDPLHHTCEDWYVNSQNIGFGMSFARELRGDIPEDDFIVLVPAGIGGTGFIDNVWTAYNGTGFVQALTRLRATFQLIAQKYPQHTALLEGFLWHQGENDAGSTALDYLNNGLIPMIKAWRDPSLLPETNGKVPFVVGNLVPSWVESRPEMQVALQVVDQFVPYSSSTPSRGLIGDKQDADLIHFTASSQRIFGRRYYASWKLAQLNGPIAD